MHLKHGHIIELPKVQALVENNFLKVERESTWLDQYFKKNILSRSTSRKKSELKEKREACLSLLFRRIG